MNDLALLNSFFQSKSFSDALVRDTLNFSSLHPKSDTLFSIRWHFLLGTLPVDVDPENAPTRCTDAWRAIWSEWESISQKRARLCETRSGRLCLEVVKGPRFDPSSDSASEDGDFCAQVLLSTGGKGCVTWENPLRPKDNSPYALQYFIDQIRKEVKRDIDRLFWDLPIFSNPQSKCDIMNILINFCLEEQKEYRQGLHEIVAFLYYICHCDGCLLERLKRETSRLSLKEAGFWDYVSLTYSSPSGLLSSTYALFKRMMSPNGLGLSHWFYQEEEDEEQNSLAIVSKCVQSDILRRIDPKLQRMLDDEYDIQAVSYVVRWLRLLFLREFSFPQSVVVWGTIFADVHLSRNIKHSFSLRNSFSLYLAATMLHAIRDELCGGYVTALRRLMSYPPVEDIRLLITKAASFATSTDLLAYIQPPLTHVTDYTGTQQAQQQRTAEAPDIPLTRDVILTQGKELTSIIERLSNPLYSESFIEKRENEQFEANYLQALAELKKVRDVLLFGVAE